MKKNIKLLTSTCCDRLLLFQTDSKKRKFYDLDIFPKDQLEELNMPSKCFIDDQLVLSPESKDDINSSISIFSELKDLDRVEANDRRLWVALTHGQFYEYTKERWVKQEKYSNEAILRRFHFEGASLEARMRNSISRLWWTAKITYEEGREDPFELTKLLWGKQDLMQNLVERSYGTYDNVIKGFLEIFKTNSQLNDDELRSLYTGLNAIGGVKLLPLLSIDDVKNEIERVANYKNIKLQF